MSNLIAVKNANNEIFITNADNFQLVDATETYGNYGQRNDELEEGWEVKAFTFHDGSNFKSFVLGEDEFPNSVNRLDSDKEADVLEAYEAADFPAEYERGIRTAESGNYEFRQSLFASDPWVATVV